MSAAAEPGAFAPLARRAFLVLWLATLVGNIGTWMRDAASAWLMTALDPSPVLVALVQAAASAPIFLLALPAGAIADLFDRRIVLLVAQLGLAGVSLALGLLTFAGLMTPWLLLLLVFLGGIGAALGNPAWQAIVPELVPRAELRPAVALNSLGINISRAIGPALGGLIIALAGVPAAYFADAASCLAVIGALLWWRRAAPRAAHPEPLLGAMRAGLRYALHAPPLHRTLLRAALFFLFAAAPWALLPLLVKGPLGAGAGGFGLMLGATGAGAVAGALLLPALRARVSAEATLTGASLLAAAAGAGLDLVGALEPAMALAALFGAGWIAAVSTLNVTAQAVLPNWVRARGLAVYLTVFFGAMTAGSALWGLAAAQLSLSHALLLAAGLGSAAALLGRARPLPATDADLAPSAHWPQPVVSVDDAEARGPVMVTVEYRVPVADQKAFATAMRALAETRRRDGATAWGLMQDAAMPERMLEWFLVATWAEHLRQHERVSEADRAVQERARAFHRGETPPIVSHLLAADQPA